MKRIFLPFATCLSALWTGCNTPPPRQAPFAGIQSAGDSLSSPYHHLSVALLPSANTKNSIEYLRKKTPGGMGYIDAEPVFEQVTGAIQATFGNVVKIADMPEARTAGTDLVAVVDIYPKKGQLAVELDAKVILLTQDGRQLDEINGHGRQSTMAYISFKADPYMIDAARKAAAQLKAGFLASSALAEFTKSKAASAATVAAAPAAPAPAAPLHSDVDSPGYGSEERPDHYALVVGIEKYSSLPDAQFAERDADAVRRHLVALGYPMRNVLYLTGQRASRAALAKNLEDWLPRNVKEDSTVFFYYSGHGAPDVKMGDAYLLPWDADAQSLEFTAYPVKRLYEKLNALKSKKIVVALDACFSGAGGRSVIAKGARPLVTKVDTAAEAAGKLVVFTASAADEITGADQEQGHGLFTYNLLQGLNASKGEATVKKLYDYLLPKVQDGARRDNRDQTPQLIPADLGDKASLRLR